MLSLPWLRESPRQQDLVRRCQSPISGGNQGCTQIHVFSTHTRTLQYNKDILYSTVHCKSVECSLDELPKVGGEFGKFEAENAPF